MKRDDFSECRLKVVHSLSRLPQKIAAAHSNENVAGLVLHELANDGCFNFVRAAYLIDNPDFDCLRGVAGFYQDEAYPDANAWQDMQKFGYHVQSAPFNQRVRGILRPSFRRRGASDSELAGALAGELGMRQHALHRWGMKNDNHGLLLYEINTDDAHDSDDLANGASLLSFCPVF